MHAPYFGINVTLLDHVFWERARCGHRLFGIIRSDWSDWPHPPVSSQFDWTMVPVADCLFSLINLDNCILSTVCKKKSIFGNLCRRHEVISPLHSLVLRVIRSLQAFYTNYSIAFSVERLPRYHRGLWQGIGGGGSFLLSHDDNMFFVECDFCRLLEFLNSPFDQSETATVFLDQSE